MKDLAKAERKTQLHHRARKAKMPLSGFKYSRYAKVVIFPVLLAHFFTWTGCATPHQQIPLKVEKPIEGAPLTFGIPFPQGVCCTPRIMFVS